MISEPSDARSGGQHITPWQVAPALAIVALVLLIAVPRLVALTSDPYPRLDWSAALLTDEGFYVHNARNVALFGHPRTDEFNNMLVSPALNGVQTAVFLLVGTGSVPARLISVVSSLATFLLLFCALRRAFDTRISVTAVLFLGLDHTNLLYNRMALMDTPATLMAVAAFYGFMRAMEGERRMTDDRLGSADLPSNRRSLFWLVTCGLLVGITITSRTLCAYLLPVPFVALWACRQRGAADSGSNGGSGISRFFSVGIGIVFIFAAYAALWYLPHLAEIEEMNRYYRVHQIQPSSFAHLLENLQHAVVGDFRGIAPYLFRHTPVVFALALAGVVEALGRWARGATSRARAAEVYLVAWLLLGWLTLAVISYSPSRYYVTTYPALASLAAVAVWRLPAMWRSVVSGSPKAQAAFALVAGFLTFHAVLAVIYYGGVLAYPTSAALLYGIPVVTAIAAWILVRRPSRVTLSLGHLVTVPLTLWFAVNAYWLTDWARHLAYTQYDLSTWLGANLPEDSVVIGDVAPGICLDNRLLAVHVQPGLCNFVQPVEKWTEQPRYVAILDGRWKERYWLQKYPDLVRSERRVKLARVLRWDVGIYSVDMPHIADATPRKVNP